MRDYISWELCSTQSQSKWMARRKFTKLLFHPVSTQVLHIPSTSWILGLRNPANSLSSSRHPPGKAKLIFPIFPSPPPFLWPSWSLLARTQLGQTLTFIPLQAQWVTAEADIPPAVIHVGHQKTSISIAPVIQKEHTLQIPSLIPGKLLTLTRHPELKAKKGSGEKFQHLLRILWMYHKRHLVEPLHQSTWLLLGWRQAQCWWQILQNPASFQHTLWKNTDVHLYLNHSPSPSSHLR